LAILATLKPDQLAAWKIERRAVYSISPKEDFARQSLAPHRFKKGLEQQAVACA